MCGYEGEHGADGMRRLSGHPECELALHGIPLGHATAGFDGGRREARNIKVLFDGDLGLLKCLIRGLLVPLFPVPDVVAALLLRDIGPLWPIGPDERCVRLERLEWIHHRLQRLVVYFHRRHAVCRRIPTGRQYAGNLLELVLHGIQWQHHLMFVHESRHVVNIVLFERFPGQHRQHAGNFERLLGVDAFDFRPSQGAANEVQIDHPRDLQIVNIISTSPDEACVLDPLSRMTQSLNFRHRLLLFLHLLGGVLHRLHDIDIAGAAAQVSGYAPANLIFGRVGILL